MLQAPVLLLKYFDIFSSSFVPAINQKFRRKNQFCKEIINQTDKLNINYCKYYRAVNKFAIEISDSESWLFCAANADEPAR